MAIFNPGQPAPSGAQQLKARRKERAANELFNVRRQVGATFTDCTLAMGRALRVAGIEWSAWAKSLSPGLTSSEAVDSDRPQPEDQPEAHCVQQ